MQTDETNRDTEVLIVGAGPAGLMMACQLAIQGIRFRIIDKKEFPTTNSGALIIQARSIEILHQMGIAYKFIHEGIIANNINIVHNGKQLLKIPVKTIGTGLSRFPFLLMVKQSKTEQLLTEFINGYGFSIERRSELLRITPDTTGVISQIKNPDKKTESIKSHYLIAADGGQSLIRKQLKIPFIGKSHQQSLFIIDCKTDGKLTEDEIYISFSDKTISGYFPMINGKWRIDGTIPKVLNAKKAVTFEDIEEHFSERTLMDTKLHSPEWFSVFHSHQHHASTFQKNS
jgi:2-polyprenyl-6-methoxyphenol hydroxylase-like FAD-dependent oxidoreductase